MDDIEQGGVIFLGKLQIPVLGLMVANAVAYASGIGRLLNFDSTQMYNLEVAVEEAVGNAVTHYSSESLHDEFVYIQFTIEEGALVISVREKGIPYDHNKTERFSPDDLERMDLPGLGEFLMNKAMDTVEFLEHGRAGKEIRLTKNIKLNNMPPELAEFTKPPKRKNRPTVKDAIIRRATIDDAPNLCRLAWRCYGYTQEDLLYDLELLKSKIASGELLSLIAIDPESSNLIGHIALKYHDDSGVPEMGLAFLDPAYRCPGLTARLGDLIREVSREAGDKGIFDCSVTTHIYSQKANQTHFGSTPCCLMLGIAAKGMQAKDLATTVQEKGSVVNHYLPFDKSSHILYLPAQHREMIADIYSWMDMPREYRDSDELKLEGEAQTFVFPLPEELNVSFIIATGVGEQTIQQIQDGLSQCKKEGRDAVYAFLPLGHKATPHIVDECEKLGFFFAGVMPHIHGGDDRIIMQYLGITLDYSNIKVYGKRSAQLLAYVVEQHEKNC